MYCEKCVVDYKMNASALFSTVQYCNDTYDAWKRLENQTKYLSAEHDQKEKEYGIPWRSAFKKEINSSLQILRLKIFGK